MKCFSDSEPTKKGAGFGSPLFLACPLLASATPSDKIFLHPGINRTPGQSGPQKPPKPPRLWACLLHGRTAMSEFDRDDGMNRRKVLECMTWVGTGVLWTISGGVPHSLGIMGEAVAQEAKGLTFLQISDSHMGFDKPANPNARGTLEEAVGKIIALPQKPAFMIHTGDITHLSKVSEFDDAD